MGQSSKLGSGPRRLWSISWRQEPSFRIGLEKKAPSTPKLASAGKHITHTQKMPSAYKSVVNRQDSSDDDMSDDGAFPGEEESGSEASTSTIRASSSESDEARAPPKAMHMPLELKNRILMLTSRGVSSRYADFRKLSCL
jgi:hypothetical protein